MSRKVSSMKRLYGKAFRFTLLAAAFMAMAGLGVYLTLTFIIKGTDTVVVPDLVGKDVLYGLEVLSDLGLNTRVKGTVFDDQVPKNHVIDQEPEPGAAIKRGRDVKIRVSRGPETIVMPNLAGLSLQHGKVLLTENSLRQVKLAGMYSFRYKTDQIIAQSPLPGNNISRDTCVDLLVSQGPPQLAYPMADLSGYTLEAAIGRLEQMQLIVGNISVVHNDHRPLETIVDQAPPAGYRVTLGSRVDLSVNRFESDRIQNSGDETDSVKLIRFHLENGFLKKRVQVKMSNPWFTITLLDEFLPPGHEVWLLAPKSGNSTILVYVDDLLVQTLFLDEH